jgi:glucan 1,3-beta-glucosidase
MDDRPISNVFDTPKTAINTPLPADNDEASILEPPRASYLLTDSTRTSSYATATPQSNNNSGPLLPAVDKPESDEYADHESKPTKTGRRRLILALIVLAVLVVIALAVVLPVYFTVIKPNQDSTDASAQPPSDGSSGDGNGGGDGNTGNTQVTTGGDGSTVTTSDGSTFTYINKLGGFCMSFPLCVFFPTAFRPELDYNVPFYGSLIQCVLAPAPVEEERYL